MALQRSTTAGGGGEREREKSFFIVGTHYGEKYKKIGGGEWPMAQLHAACSGLDILKITPFIFFKIRNGPGK